MKLEKINNVLSEGQDYITYMGAKPGFNPLRG